MVRSLSSLRVIALAAILGLTGCSSVDPLTLTEGDVHALDRIYQSGGWRFQKSKFDVSVLGNDSIKIGLKGKAIRRDGSDESPIMIPITLIARLPQYYEIIGSNEANTELQSYRVAGGMWSIVAVVPAPLTAEESRLDIDVLLVSSEIQNTIPLLIPAGQSESTVDASVSLPAHLKFGSLSLSTYPDREMPLSLTSLPPSMSDGQNRAAAKLPSNRIGAWDFSKVTYSTAPPAVLSPRWLPLVLTASVAVVMLSYLFLPAWWSRRRQQAILLLKQRRGEEAAALVSIMSALGRRMVGIELISEIIWQLKGQRRAFVGDEEVEQMRKLERQTDESAFFIDSAKPTTRMLDLLGRFEFHLERMLNINTQLVQFHSQLRGASMPRASIISALFSLLILLIFFQNLFGQEPLPQATLAPAVRVAALGEFGITVKPVEADINRVEIRLSFIPLANSKAKDEKGVVGMGTGDSTQAEINDFKWAPEKMVESIQVSKKSVSVKAPITPMSGSLIDVLGDDAAIKVSAIDIRRSYQDSVGIGNVVRFDYALTGTFNHDYKTENGWVHWFPFDTKSIEIPLRLVQPAILQQIEFIKPPEFSGEISAQGFDADFTDKGKTFNLQFKDSISRNTIYPDQDVKISAQFTRSWTQRLWLTAGQIGFALVGGVLLGWIASRANRIGYVGLIEGFGVLGLGFVIRSSVFSAYPGLPSILAGQTPITILDIFFVISLVVLLVASGYSCLVLLEKKVARRGS